MATKNGVTAKATITKTTVKKQLASDAKKPTAAKDIKEQTVNPAVELASRIERFQKLQGLCHQREKLNETLSDLLKFTYHSDGSALFLIRDASSTNREFRTNNSRLIELVSSQLQEVLDKRRQEINAQIIAFEL